jgi:ureidoacrylate peracid hydrolase
MDELLTSLEQKVAPDNAALVVIDVQNDFVANEGWGASVGWDPSRNQAAARRIADLLPHVRSAGLPVVFIQAIYDEPYLGAPMIERNRRLGIDQPRCISGTWGADFYAVRPEPTDTIVRKHRYSAFAETELNTVLRHLGVRSLLLCGVYSEGCVESTARDAYFLDYYVTLIDDCCATTSDEIHRGVLERCEHDWGIVTTSEELLRVWGAAGSRSSATPPAAATTQAG